VTLPKPLIVVLVVIVVLALVGCGMAVLGRDDHNRPAASLKSDLEGSKFTDILKGFGPIANKVGPPPKPIASGEFTTTCGTGTPGQLSVAISCAVSIGETQDTRRQMVLRPDGTMSIQISSTANGHQADSDSQTTSGDATIDIAQGAVAVATLTCTCTVFVNPSPTP
jgi:hypothetical protein